MLFIFLPCPPSFLSYLLFIVVSSPLLFLPLSAVFALARLSSLSSNLLTPSSAFFFPLLFFFLPLFHFPSFPPFSLLSLIPFIPIPLSHTNAAYLSTPFLSLPPPDSHLPPYSPTTLHPTSPQECWSRRSHMKASLEHTTSPHHLIPLLRSQALPLP